MKIVFVASEMAPFASTGSLGDSVAALAAAVAARGHEVSAIVPYYRAGRERGRGAPKRTGTRFSVQVGEQRLPCEVREGRSPDGVQVFFIERDEFFDRTGLYGVDGRDYQDNSTRFTYFAKCAVEVVRRMDPAPEIVHAHDWQTALVPVLARDQGVPVRTVLGVGSLAYQGNFWSYDFGLTNLPGRYFSAAGLEYFGSLNFLKGGILFADRVILPGPRWVGEAQSREFGFGLDPVLREHAGKLEGVTPGSDFADWNPSTDKAIAKRFRAPSGKTANRRAWLAASGLDSASAGPSVALFTSAMSADAADLLAAAADLLAPTGLRIAVLGRVARERVAALASAVRRNRGRLVWVAEPPDDLVRSALAGSDALFFPEPVRPEATWLLRGLRYGAVPVWAGCAGGELLAPSWTSGHPAGVGFPFHVRSAEAAADALRTFAVTWGDAATRAELVSRAMAADFSWANAAARTENVYRSVTGAPLAEAA